MSKIDIREEDLDNVTGGKITYTWNGTEGSIGINGNNNFKLLNKDAFVSYYAENKETMTEKDILKNLAAMGIIVKP